MSTLHKSALRRKAALNSAKVLLTAASVAATVWGWGALSAGANSAATVAQTSATTASVTTSASTSVSASQSLLSALQPVARTRASR